MSFNQISKSNVNFTNHGQVNGTVTAFGPQTASQRGLLNATGNGINQQATINITNIYYLVEPDLAKVPSTRLQKATSQSQPSVSTTSQPLPAPKPVSKKDDSNPRSLTPPISLDAPKKQIPQLDAPIDSQTAPGGTEEIEENGFVPAKLKLKDVSNPRPLTPPIPLDAPKKQIPKLNSSIDLQTDPDGTEEIEDIGFVPANPTFAELPEKDSPPQTNKPITEKYSLIEEVDLPEGKAKLQEIGENTVPANETRTTACAVVQAFALKTLTQIGNTVRAAVPYVVSAAFGAATVVFYKNS